MNTVIDADLYAEKIAGSKPILSIEADAKTSKGTDKGILTGILYLAPSDESGIANVCPHASEGCRKACLFSAGRGKMSHVRNARINKTKLFFNDRSTFWKRVIWSIEKVIRKARKNGLQPAIRLNGTSDLPWERIAVKVDGERLSANIMELYPDVQFYDYTKVPERFDLPENYHLTFSLSESNDKVALNELRNGRSVAVVFDGQLPDTYSGFNVIDGDKSDIRFNDPSGVVVGLTAKGEAKKDDSGFVRDPNDDMISLPTL